MQRLSLLLCLLAMVLTNATAQGTKDDKQKKKGPTISIYGKVHDQFTGGAIKARITVMQADDSLVVDTTTAYTWHQYSEWWIDIPRREGRYLLKGEADGYETGWLEFSMLRLRRKNSFEVPPLRMKKLADKEVALGDGVVVTGTRVRMVYRGDTIVYNASAFQLPEGSMLDALVRQMPGAELKDNGDILINGRKIDYLTLNGTDFFRGNNKMMLDNLPYYAVQDVKVYDKTSDESRHRGYEATKKDYVMDVNLKRQYNRAYIANVEAGYGTDDRYMGRVFGLYFDDLTRLSLFGNINNVNENRRPGGEGEWTPSNMPTGLKTTRQVGLNFTTTNKDKTFDETLDATAEWSDNRSETRTESETFATDGNIFGRGSSEMRQKDFRMSASNDLSLEGKTNMRHSLNVSFYSGHADSWSQDSTYRQRVINQTMNDGYRKYRHIEGETVLYWYKQLPWGDNISLGGKLQGERSKPSDSYSRRRTQFAETGSGDYRHYYVDTHDSGYEWSLWADYAFSLPNKWYISASYRFTQNQHSYENCNYRLDWLGQMNVGGMSSSPTALQQPLPLVYLPSAIAALDSVIDPDNSDTHSHMQRTHSASISLTHSTDKGYFSISLPLERISERMHYFDPAGFDTIAHRRDWQFQPNISFLCWGKNTFYTNYSLSLTRPDFASLMPGDDSSNPLHYGINNLHLKNQLSHNVWLNATFRNDSTKRQLTLSGNFSLTRNAWGTRQAYNSQTGAYLTMNDNVNGNWSSSLEFGLQMPLDSARRWTLENTLSPSFNHSVDFDLYTYSETGTASHLSPLTTYLYNCPLSHVNNAMLHDRFRLNYHLGELDLSLVADASWRRAWSNRQNFQRINTWDWSYGLTARYKIPWLELQVNTDIKMFQRRGYGSSLMNSDDLIWNAELSRSFIKGRLVARLQAFDLLGQLSTRQYNINAQGRTETWTLCLPRYALLTLSWRLNKMPKGKEQ